MGHSHEESLLRSNCADLFACAISIFKTWFAWESDINWIATQTAKTFLNTINLG